MRTDRRAQALLLVMVVSVLVFSLLGSLVGYSVYQQRATYTLNAAMLATYGAEAGLQKVRYNVWSSRYDAEGNKWLHDNADDEDDGRLVWKDLKIGKALVSVWLKQLPDGIFRATVKSTVDKVTITLTQDIRERDSFSKYMFFIDKDTISFGTSTVRGYVHSNRGINFNYGGARFTKFVSAVTGFTFANGATETNTIFEEGSNRRASAIPLPPFHELTELKPVAEGAYRISPDNPPYSGLPPYDVYLELRKDKVNITAKKKGTNVTLLSQDLPLPPNGLMYVEGDIESLQGDIAGRCTIACTGEVRIRGSLRYVDADGDPAYIFTDAAGHPITPPPNDAWTEANGIYYKPNPNYDADPPSVLGLMSKGDIQITWDAPFNIERHGAMFSVEGKIYAALEDDKGGRIKKGNLKVLGSVVSKLGGWRYSGGDLAGYGKSGEYVYDENLLTYPPPHYLQVDTPTFGPTFKKG